jgi:tRNA threonylcarbamoyladenosine biosynthesis protein TsaE
MTYRTNSPEQTKQVAADFARSLRGGEVVSLVGNLGSGKTTFVQGLCQALGVQETVTSPTFSIMNRYVIASEAKQSSEIAASPSAPRNDIRFIVHLDLYRLKTIREIAALGLEEYLNQPDTLVLIEWPEAVEGVQWNPTHTIRFETVSATERSIRIYS